jgi:hypothetical protein
VQNVGIFKKQTWTNHSYHRLRKGLRQFLLHQRDLHQILLQNIGTAATAAAAKWDKSAAAVGEWAAEDKSQVVDTLAGVGKTWANRGDRVADTVAAVGEEDRGVAEGKWASAAGDREAGGVEEAEARHTLHIRRNRRRKPSLSTKKEAWLRGGADEAGIRWRSKFCGGGTSTRVMLLCCCRRRKEVKKKKKTGGKIRILPEKLNEESSFY